MPDVYTRTGDQGLTGLFGGSRLPKQAPIVEAYGTVDEANAAIGNAKVWVDDEYHDVLHGIQQRLFTLAAELASDDQGRARIANTIGDADVAALEHVIDGCLAIATPVRRFVVPGRDHASAALHQARTVVRRAERRVLTAGESHPVRPELIRYLNRLSDALYAIARVEETRSDLVEIERIVRRAVEHVMGGGGSQPPYDNLRNRPSTDGAAADGGRTALLPQGSAGDAVTPGPEERWLPFDRLWNRLPKDTDASTRRLDLATAKALAEAAEAKAAAMGVPIVFAAVDDAGLLILAHRMAGALLASTDLAINKAYTAAALKMPTADLRTAAGVDGPLYGIEASNQGRLVLFGGGLPVFCGPVLLGGVGVSGGTVDQDVAIVEFACHTVYGS